MKYELLIQNGCLYFSGWSKKGYSIFAGLGREVRISRLALHMYGNVLLKSSSNGVIINTDSIADFYMDLIKFIYVREIIGCTARGEVRPVEANIFKRRKGYIAEMRYVPFYFWNLLDLVGGKKRFIQQ